jgi:hypothetical protein
MSWPQSLPLCILFSVLAGVYLVLSTTVLAITRSQAKRWEDAKSKKLPKKCWALGYIGNFLFQLLSFGFQTLSMFVGPVSIAAPFSLSSQLLANVLIFSIILKYEPLSKDTLVGTLVNTVGVYLLVFVGAEFTELEQDIVELLSTNKAIIWSIVVVSGSAISFPYQFLRGFFSESRLVSDRRSFFFLMMSEICNSVLAASSLKALALTEGSRFIFTAIVATYSNGMVLYTTMLRAVVIKNQTIYVPIAITLYLASSGITGAVIWNDEIKSQGAYCCVFVLFGLAGYLLNDFELTSLSNAQFKYGSLVERGFSIVHVSSTAFHEQIQARRHTSFARRPNIMAHAMTAVDELRQEMRNQGFTSYEFSRALSLDISIDPRIHDPEYLASKDVSETSVLSLDEVDPVELMEIDV